MVQTEILQKKIFMSYEFLDISNIFDFLVGSFEKVRQLHLCYFLFPIATNWVFLLSSLCTPLWPSLSSPPLQEVGLTAPAQLYASRFSIIAPASSHRTDFCFPLHSPLSPVPTLATGVSLLPLFNCMQTVCALIPPLILGNWCCCLYDTHLASALSHRPCPSTHPHKGWGLTAPAQLHQIIFLIVAPAQ